MPCQGCGFLSACATMMLVQVLVPVTILAVYHAFAYSAKTFSNHRLWKQYGVKAHAFLAAHQVNFIV